MLKLLVYNIRKLAKYMLCDPEIFLRITIWNKGLLMYKGVLCSKWQKVENAWQEYWFQYKRRQS